MIWIQIKADINVGPDLDSNWLQRLSADAKKETLFWFW